MAKDTGNLRKTPIYIYPPVIKHGNGKLTLYEWFFPQKNNSCGIFHCHVWLPEGIGSSGKIIEEKMCFLDCYVWSPEASCRYLSTRIMGEKPLNTGKTWTIPSVENMAIEIVSFSSKHGGFPVRYVHLRVVTAKIHKSWHQKTWKDGTVGDDWLIFLQHFWAETLYPFVISFDTDPGQIGVERSVPKRVCVDLLLKANIQYV